MLPVCRNHPAVDAWYRCDDCGRHLCDDCVEVASRLAVCLPCGGLARPIVRAEEPAARPDPPSGTGSFSGAEALAWPLLGIQGLALAFCTILLAVPVAAEILLPPATCLLIVPRLLVALLIPGVLADIARASAEGLPGLPEWPPYPAGRFGEIVRFVGAGLLALAPAAMLLAGSGCAEEIALHAVIPPVCHLLLVVGLWPSAFLWLPLYGATVLRGGLGVLLDAVAHGRVMRRHGRELARDATLCAIPLALAASARTFAPVPVIGGVLEVVLALYGAGLGAHLAGAFLHRHRDELEAMYDG